MKHHNMPAKTANMWLSAYLHLRNILTNKHHLLVVTSTSFVWWSSAFFYTIYR